MAQDFGHWESSNIDPTDWANATTWFNCGGSYPGDTAPDHTTLAAGVPVIVTIPAPPLTLLDLDIDDSVATVRMTGDGMLGLVTGSAIINEDVDVGVLLAPTTILGMAGNLLIADAFVHNPGGR